MNHPTKESMTLLAYGFLTASEEAAARAHLAECAACRAEWNAARGEVASVKAAFEPAAGARPRLLAWWPMVAGFAAALLGGLVVHAVRDGDPGARESRPEAERRAAQPMALRAGEMMVLAEWDDARYRQESATRWTLDNGTALFANWGVGEATVEAGNVKVYFAQGAEIVVTAGNGESRILCRTGAGKVTANGGTIELQPGDTAAIVAGQAPCVLRADEDAAKRLAALSDRVALLEHSVVALRNSGANPESAEAVGTWLAKQAAQGRMMGEDKKVGDELGRLWMRVMRETGVMPAELEAGTAREKLIAGYLEGRGCPLSPEKRHAWEEEIASHEQAAQQYLQARQELSGLEKALALARVAAGRGPRYDALLDDAQKKAMAELDPAFRDWRQSFASVFKVVVGTEGPDKALDQVGMMSGGISDRAREIERSLLDGCLSLHRDADPADPAAEQVALLELLAKTRDLLVKDAGLTAARANGLLVNFVEGAKK